MVFARALVRQLLAPLVEPRKRALLMLYALCSLCAFQAYYHLSVTALPVAVVDMDNSQLSRTLKRILMAEQLVEVSDVPIESPEQARQLLVRGEIRGVVLIPSDFSSSVKRGQPVPISAAIDGSNILVAKNIYKALATAAVNFGVGVAIVKAEKLGVPSRDALHNVMPLRLQSARPFNPAANYAIYIVPGLLYFLLEIFLLLLASGYFQPRLARQSWLSRLSGMGATCVLGWLMCLLLAYVVLPQEAIVPQSSFALIAAMSALFVLATGLLVVALHGAIPEAPLAMDVCVFLGMLSLMASGITFPTDLFPKPLASFSYILPLQPFAQAFQVYLHRATNFTEVAPQLRLLVLQCGVYLSIAIVSWSFRGRWRTCITQRHGVSEQQSQSA